MQKNYFQNLTNKFVNANGVIVQDNTTEIGSYFNS